MDKYAVIGHPVEHSLSPKIHAAFAAQTEQQLTYKKIEAPLDAFKSTLFHFQAQDGCGANITLPFKTQAFELAHEHSDAAKKVCAANTLVFREDGTIFADTTDGVGLIQDITHNHHYSLRQKRILVLGAGGATRSIIPFLLGQAPAKLMIANRTAKKAEQLADEFRLLGEVSGFGIDQLEASPFDLIINATSAGLTGTFPELPGALISSTTWCYDLYYAKNATPFLQWAAQYHPEQCLDGIGMLVEQAAASFYVWRGVYPDTAPVIDMLQKQYE